MTDSPVSDTTDLEKLVSGFATTYENFNFGDPELRTAVRDIQYALAGEERTDWVTVYDNLELISFGSGGEVRAQAVTLMKLIEDQGLIPV